jgi:uroporphyrin-3 C-methyltransferase
MLLALAAAGYWGWQQYRLSVAVPAPLVAADPRIDELVAASARQAAEVRALAEQLERQAQVQAELRQRQDALAGALERAQRTLSDGDLLAALEAEELLRLAAQRLWVSRAADQALPLLVRADELLAQRADPGLEPVRAALAADLTALRLIETPDVEGIYLRLEALQDGMDTLPLVPRPERAEAEAVAAPAATAAGFWARLWDNAVAAARRFSAEHLRVRTLEQAPPGLLSAAAEGRLRQYLRLLLSQAQFALLERQPGIYRAALGKAIELLEAHFGSDERVAATAAALTELRARNIAPQLPDLRSAREQLRGYVLRRSASTAQEPLP